MGPSWDERACFRGLESILFEILDSWPSTEADKHREPGEFNLAQNLIFQTFYCRNKH